MNLRQLNGMDSKPSDFVKGVCAVVVTYHPEEDIAENIKAIAAECDAVVVVDNGSDSASLQAVSETPRVEILVLRQNYGLAAALNLGVERASERGYTWVVTFDQDSRPEKGMIREMNKTRYRQTQAVIVVPRICEENSDPRNYRWLRRSQTMPFLFKRVGCENEDLSGVSMAISSGSMIEVKTWKEVAGFNSGFFIDYIDTDFCLKVIRRGGLIVVCAKARLAHRLGARKCYVVLGHEVRPTNHATFRQFYIARNRVHVWKRHALALPYWAAFDISFAVLNFLRIWMFEQQRWRKTVATFRGTWHGLLGKMGEMPK